MKKRATAADWEKHRPGVVPVSPAHSPNLSDAVSTVKKKSQAKIPNKEPEGLRQIKQWLRVLNIDFVTEHEFHPIRKWRFDIAIPAHKLAVEYEGIFSQENGQNGHTGAKHYVKDTQKYNAAQILGWRVLRYTAKNIEEFLADITEIIKP